MSFGQYGYNGGGNAFGGTSFGRKASASQPVSPGAGFDTGKTQSVSAPNAFASVQGLSSGGVPQVKGDLFNPAPRTQMGEGRKLYMNA